MKRKFLTFSLIFLLAFSSVIMLACGGSGVNPYDEINEIITTITTDTSTYQNGAVLDGTFTGYTIKGLAHKEGGVSVDDGQALNGIFAISTNEIIKYKDFLQNIKPSKLDSLNKTFNSFKDEYQNFLGARERFLTLEDYASADVYNGFYARFREETKSYVNATCDLAKEILKACEENFVLSEEKPEESKKEQMLLKYDNEIIKALGDVKDLLLKSAKGEILAGGLYQYGMATLKNIASNANKTRFNLKEENEGEFEKISLALDNQRKIISQAIDNFSIYEFEREYESSLYLYCKTDSTKEFDYAQLDLYFKTDGILQRYFTTINNL